MSARLPTPPLRQLARRLVADDLTRALARGASGSLALAVLGAMAGLGLQVLLARLLGVEGYGAYAYALACLGLLAVVGRFGLDTTLLRYASVYAAAGQGRLLRRMLRATAALTLGVSLAVGGLLLLVVGLLDRFQTGLLDPRLTATLRVGATILPILVLVMLSRATLRALGRVLRAVASEMIVLPVALAALALGATGALGALDAPLAVGLHGGASLVVLGLLAGWLRTALRQLGDGEAVSGAFRSWVVTALPLLAMALFSLANSRLDLLLVGGMLGPEAAGIYAAASRVAVVSLWGLNGVNTVLPPLVARLHAARDRRDLERLLARAALALTLMTLPLAALLLGAGGWLLAAFGPAYGSGLGVLRILVVANSLNALAGSVGYLLTMTGNQRRAAGAMGIATALNLLLNLWWIPWLGAMGAAFATLVSTAVWNGWMYIQVRRRLGVDPSILALVRWRSGG